MGEDEFSMSPGEADILIGDTNTPAAQKLIQTAKVNAEINAARKKEREAMDNTIASFKPFSPGQLQGPEVRPPAGDRTIPVPKKSR